MEQSVSFFLMVKPKTFGYDEESAETNAFQERWVQNVFLVIQTTHNNCLVLDRIRRWKKFAQKSTRNSKMLSKRWKRISSMSQFSRRKVRPKIVLNRAKILLFFIELANWILTFSEGGPARPDSIFPNNWFSTHEDGTLVLYPMAAKSRWRNNYAISDWLT